MFPLYLQNTLRTARNTVLITIRSRFAAISGTLHCPSIQPPLMVVAPRVADTTSTTHPLEPTKLHLWPSRTSELSQPGDRVRMCVVLILPEGRMMRKMQPVGVVRPFSLCCWSDPWCMFLHLMQLSFIPIALLQCLRSSCLFCIAVQPSPVLTVSILCHQQIS